jgi:hypothetical protein
MDSLITENMVFLEHTRQHPKYGCMAAAYFACTHDTRFLSHQTETQQFRLSAIAARYGYCTYAMWDGAGKVLLPKKIADYFWECLLEDSSWNFVASVPSSTLKVALHSVAIAVIKKNQQLYFVVSDSQLEKKLHFEHHEFRSSRYNQIYELVAVDSIDATLAQPARTQAEVLAYLESIESANNS